MFPLYHLVNKFFKHGEQKFQGSDVEYYNGDLPHSHIIQVPHVNQECAWDCGLACVLMVLKTVGKNNISIQELGELCCTTSIWTVDLAYLLQKNCINFFYFTVTLGANPKYSVEEFYKDQLPDDLSRVDTLFQNAKKAGIDIQRRSVSGEEITLFILSGKYIAIVLVDQHKLSRSWLEELCVSSFYDDTSDYTGHYIVICGYDSVRDEFEIRDPASSKEHERVSLKCLEEARKSFGTDEDLLLISLEKSEFGNCASRKLLPEATDFLQTFSNI